MYHAIGVRTGAVSSIQAGWRITEVTRWTALRTGDRIWGNSLLADYKVPRSLHLVDEIERSPAGKPDYRWARDIADAARLHRSDLREARRSASFRAPVA